MGLPGAPAPEGAPLVVPEFVALPPAALPPMFELPEPVELVPLDMLLDEPVDAPFVLVAVDFALGFLAAVLAIGDGEPAPIAGDFADPGLVAPPVDWASAGAAATAVARIPIKSAACCFLMNTVCSQRGYLKHRLPT